MLCEININYVFQSTMPLKKRLSHTGDKLICKVYFGNVFTYHHDDTITLKIESKEFVYTVYHALVLGVKLQVYIYISA